MDKFDEGYEEGILSTVSYIYGEVQGMKESKAKKFLLDFLHEHYEAYIPVFGNSEPTAYERKFCYLKTVNYRGFSIEFYTDDYGQQDYFYYKGQPYSCGAYNLYPEEYMEYIVDRDLDFIMDFSEKDERFFGARCEYADHEHTIVNFIFRGISIDTFKVDTDDPSSVKNICKDCEKRLELLFEDPEFLDYEANRKSEGNLYFDELAKIHQLLAK